MGGSFVACSVDMIEVVNFPPLFYFNLVYSTEVVNFPPFFYFNLVYSTDEIANSS